MQTALYRKIEVGTEVQSCWSKLSRLTTRWNKHFVAVSLTTRWNKLFVAVRLRCEALCFCWSELWDRLFLLVNSQTRQPVRLHPTANTRMHSRGNIFYLVNMSLMKRPVGDCTCNNFNLSCCWFSISLFCLVVFSCLFACCSITCSITCRVVT